MKNVAMILTFLVGLPLAASAQVPKEDIKKLAAAGISDDVILSYVKANGGVARLSAEDIVELKQAGTSEKVLSVILAGGSSTPAPAPAAPARTATPYYYQPSTTVYESDVIYPASYSYSAYASTYYPRSYYYPSYYYPSYYSSGYCYPRYYSYSSWYPSVSFGWSSGRHCSSRGYIGIGGYRR